MHSVARCGLFPTFAKSRYNPDKTMKTNLTKIVDYLLLKSLYIHDIGLFHGKMGIVLALFAYADRYKDHVLEEYAWDLFQQVYDGMHADLPLGLENGLSGIGYGTTLMCAKGWAECDLNAVLADVDDKIMQHDPRRLKDSSLRSGTGGLQLYLDFRQSVSGPLLTFDRLYLSELQSVAPHKFKAESSANFVKYLTEPAFPMDEYLEKPIGIDGGSAYYILENTLP